MSDRLGSTHDICFPARVFVRYSTNIDYPRDIAALVNMLTNNRYK